MNIEHLRIGIIHSLIGKNDGVSIVIDQTILAMIDRMDVPLGNIYLLGAHSPARFNTTLEDIFWHKHEVNKYILKHYTGEPPAGFEDYIMQYALKAKQIIADFVEENSLDLLIIHNSCHPCNFIYAVGAGLYFEEINKAGRMTPRYLLWWHDSHFERERFKNPNSVIQKFLKYIPGKYINGIVFINSQQEKMARRALKGENFKDLEGFFEKKTITVPNTCEMEWDWQQPMDNSKRLAPVIEDFNKTFFKDIGLEDVLMEKNCLIDDAVFLLQHTRIVERKRIDHSIDLAFRLAQKFHNENNPKNIVLLVSGHSGDEFDSYLLFLKKYFEEQKEKFAEIANHVILYFGEHLILSEREVIVEKKYYRFSDIPGILANKMAIGTYFSEVEGYGNNLLEMMSMGLPAVINKYPIYESDIESLGFDLPAIKNGEMPEEFINQCYRLLTDIESRNKTVIHNLNILNEKLHHGIIAEKLKPIFRNIFKYI